MPRYIKLSIPQGDVELMVEELRAIREPDLQTTWSDRERLVRRLQAALRGRDLRVHNSHNTHKVKRPRVELDLRKKAS